MFFLVHVDGNTPAVIGYGYGVVFVDENVDAVTVAGQCFIDRVIDYFIYQMMQTFDADVADIHGRAFSYGFEAFEYLYAVGGVAGILFVVFF